MINCCWVFRLIDPSFVKNVSFKRSSNFSIRTLNFHPYKRGIYLYDVQVLFSLFILWFGKCFPNFSYLVYSLQSRHMVMTAEADINYRSINKSEARGKISLVFQLGNKIFRGIFKIIHIY